MSLFSSFWNDPFFRNPSALMSRFERDMFDDPFFNWPAHRSLTMTEPDQEMKDASTAANGSSKTKKSDGKALIGSSTSGADPDQQMTREDYFTHVIRAPAFDVTTAENQYLCTFDVPGVNKDDVKVQVTDNADGTHNLTVSGERKDEQESGDKNQGNYRYVSRYGKFSRTVRLPKDIQPEGIKAKHDNGTLKVTVPRVKPAVKPVTQVNIE